MVKILTLKLWSLLFVGLVFFAGFNTPKVYAGQNDTPHVTGLPELTAEELEWQNKHMLKVKKIKLNKLGLERINRHRKAKGLNSILNSEGQVNEIGQDIEGAVGATADEVQTTESIPGGIPSFVDNSTLKYFPPIGNQGSLPSCGVFNGTYYAMTYMYAFANDIDAKNGGNACHLSPKWTYNMVNGGGLNGTWYYWAYEIGQKHGCATYADFPYVGSTSNPLNYREWSTNPVVWREAIDRRFDQYGYVDGTNTDTGINLVKEMILNGYILNIPTYIYSWQSKTISNDPATTADDAFVGKNCTYWVNGTSGYHAMTVVGYNDDIWVDINSNGVVDNGEKGAFRIANSWGTSWGEGGFGWMSYDALKNPSSVSGGPSAGRITGWSPARAHWVTARANYQPTMVAQFTLNHLKRNQLRVTLGTSDVTQSTPQTTWYPEMIYLQGGPYAFNGTTTAVNGTFVFDLTDIAPADGEQLKYYVGIYDSSSGDPAKLSAFTLYDELNMESVTSSEPVSVDVGIAYSTVDYSNQDGNAPPESDFTVNITYGFSPLTVVFADSSSDTDGNIVNWAWNFGDGSNSASQNPTHIFTSAGTFTVELTVTDDKGATDSTSMNITVEDVNTPPTADFFADIVTGTAPLPVVFTDNSSDADGSIASWSWDFDDGSYSSSRSPSHTYTRAGTFTAKLTVADNKGATNSASMVITVSEPLEKATYVSDIAMSITVSRTRVNANAMVKILDENGVPVVNAVVTGLWSGLVSGASSGITGTDGTATLGSPKSRRDGTIKFAVTNVSASGYYYEPAMNHETADSISTIVDINQAPQAVTNVSAAFGTAPLEIIFSPEGSYDPDGTIVSYEWNFGDGSSGTGQSVNHTYTSTGTYLATLTVRDNNGATGSDTIYITITSGDVKSLYVGSVDVSVSGDIAYARVLILGDYGPVGGATVTGEWSGLVAGIVSGVTNNDGSVTLVSRKSKKTGDFIFAVTNVSKEGYVYDQSQNTLETDSFTVQK